jgi:hypothetical protein
MEVPLADGQCEPQTARDACGGSKNRLIIRRSKP